ncbi:AsmA-like C-terminal region-containing protein [uncultured Bradyrhizobium sp.]|uniref:AsmA family protein n=1 Tax=uncultured Bradyrhizobium sp. TaxID=199684 RepID=UPI0035CC3313
MQTTLLGLAIAFIIALIAALVGPYFIDWNRFRPQFEAEATRVVGAPVRVGGALDARLLPTPSLRLRSVVVGGAGDRGKVGADTLDVEFSLGSLMRGEWRATELTVNGMALDLGLDGQGRIDGPASTGTFNLGSLAIDRLNLTGRIVLHDAASRGTLELDDIAFSGDVRSLAGSIRGDGNFMLAGIRYPFRVSSGQSPGGSGTRVHLTVDAGARARSVDLDGVLTFDARSPRFDGAVNLAGPAGPKPATGDATQMPWRLSAKLKADPSAARLEQIEASYGAEENPLKLSGSADVRFGAAPLLHALLSARRLDADKLLARDSGAAEPTRLLPGLRYLVTAIPPASLATQIELSAEQIMLGGRPIQNIAADLRGDPRSWTIDRLEFGAPGSTRVHLRGEIAQPGPSASFKGAVSIDSSDPDTLAGWLQGRGEIVYRSQKPLRVSGNLAAASDRVAIDGLKAEIDGGALEGRVAILNLAAGEGARIEAALKADQLDLDAAVAFTRSLAGPQAEWPKQAELSLDIGRAVSGSQELRPFVTKLSYGPNTISLDRLQIGDAGGVMMDGAGSFDRANATGRLTLNASTASFARFTALIAPVAPVLTARLNAMAVRPGPARLKLSLDLDKNPDRADRAKARAVLDIDAPEFKGVTTVTATPVIAAMRGIDLDALAHGEIGIEAKLSSARGPLLLTLLGLDRLLGAGDGRAQFEGSATGVWGAPIRLKARLSGAELDADVQGTAEPWAAEPAAAVNLSVRRASLAPLSDRGPSDPLAPNITLSSRLTLAGSKLVFDDMDSTVGGSRMRGRVALTFGDEKSVDGGIGLDTFDLAAAFGLAIGAAGHDASEPLGRGLLQGWRGRLAFQALRGTLPGGGELRPVGGVVKSDGQSFTFENLKGTIGGGAATADVEAKRTPDGVALNARLQLSGVDGAALRYRGLAMPTGRASMQMTLASQGRSASALSGALSGGGSLTLQSARIAGFDPRAFEVAIRASDIGEATDDVKLRQIVEPALSAGALSVASAQIPFTIKEGRLRVSATTLDAEGARVIVSGGYDMAADQTDIRATLSSTTAGSAASRPEIQVFAVGSPDALDRTVDVATLSAWLAVRAIDRETRRLDAIERGEIRPPALPASIPPAIALPPVEAAPAGLPDAPVSEIPIPGRDPRRPAPKPRVSVPAAPLPAAPVVSQHLAPLPPPIEIRPAPGPAAKPKPRPPLVLTPPLQAGPRSAF